MAHNEFEILEKLVMRLDYANNDIFIHVDKKVKDFDQTRIIRLVKKAKLEFTKRLNVAWGGDSQIKAEIMLMKKASKEYHDYYHLLSGVDLPIKSHDYIEKFFQMNKGKEYIFFDENEYEKKIFLKRLRYYHFPVNNFNEITKIASTWFSKAAYKAQYLFHTDRLKKSNIPIEDFQKGSTWFDISHDLVKYVLLQMEKKSIGKLFQIRIVAMRCFYKRLYFGPIFILKCVMI